MIRSYRKWLWQNIILFFILSSIIALSSSCDILKLGATVDKIKDNSGAIGENLGAGLVEGIDTSQLDSVIKRVVGQIGNTLNEEIDSIYIKNLEDQLKNALVIILNEGRDSIKAILADTTAFDNVDAKIQGILGRMGGKVDRLMSGLIPNALNQQNLNTLYALRDSLIGNTTKGLLEQALVGSIEELVKSEELKELIKEVTDVVDETTGKVETTAKGISRTVVTIGAVIAGILLVLLLALWLRKRAQARQQKELLVKLTKAIDAIPDQGNYDRTVAFLQEQISESNDSRQGELLDQILEDYQHQYPQKKKYQDYQQRLIDYLKEKNQDRSISQQLFQDIEDEEFKNYLRNELE